MLILTPRSVAALSRKRSLLDFDFIFNQSLDPRISFSRTTIGTRFNSAGLLVTESPNVPRFDYDPATLSALGLLVEPQRTNLFVRSAAFNDAAWSKTAVTVTADTTTAPDGTLSADSMLETATVAKHGIYQSPSISLGHHVVSCFIRDLGRWSQCGITEDAIDYQAWFDPSTGTAVNGSGVTSQLQACQGGWLRASVVRNVVSSTTGKFLFLDDTSSGSSAYVGDITKGVYLWGAQLEAGAFATSYIPTTGSQFTRTADVPQVTLPQPADILVQDREGGAWITGIPAGPYTMAPRTDKRHIARWRAFPAGYAASHPELAVAYP